MISNPMINYIKTISHVERLQVIGVLAIHPSSMLDIAKELNQPVRQVFAHIEMLAQEGIITQHYSKWKLDTSYIENLSRENLGKPVREIYTPIENVEAKTLKVLSIFLNPDGSIRQLPAEAGKLIIILHYLVQAFEAGIIYSEKEVNQIIKRYHPDYASLRREMIDRNLLSRKSDGSAYWRTE